MRLVLSSMSVFSLSKAGRTNLYVILFFRATRLIPSLQVEGTYSAGDWGIAAGVGYTNRNIFRGAEELSLSGRCSYEWRQTGGRALEGKAEAALRFPSSTKLSVSYNYQNRPEEYTRTIANANVQHTLSSKNKRLNHYFNIFDISYVYLHGFLLNSGTIFYRVAICCVTHTKTTLL